MKKPDLALGFFLCLPMKNLTALFLFLGTLNASAQSGSINIKIVDERGKNIPHCHISHLHDSSLRFADDDASIQVKYTSSQLNDTLLFRSVGHYDTFSTIAALVRNPKITMARYAYPQQISLGDHLLKDTMLGDISRKKYR